MTMGLLMRLPSALPPAPSPEGQKIWLRPPWRLQRLQFAQHPHRPGRYAALFPSQARNTGAPWSRRRRICRRTACSGVCVKTRRTSWRSAGSGIRRRLSASVQASTTFLLCFVDRQLPKGQVWRPRMIKEPVWPGLATSTSGALVLFCSGSLWFGLVVLYN